MCNFFILRLKFLKTYSFHHYIVNPLCMIRYWYHARFAGGEWRSKYFAYLGTYVLFVEQPVVSLSLCNGAIQWLVEVGWEWPVIFNRLPLQMYARNRWSPIHIFIYLLPNYTFYTNLTILSAGYLRIGDVTSLITFNLWKVEKSMKHRLMPV